MKENSQKRFLIINPFGIGDVLFTTPVVRTIKQNYPDSFVGYWCNQRAEAVLKNNPYINKVFPLSRGDIKKFYGESKLKGINIFLKLLYKIKKEHFNISLDFSLDHRYSLISKLLGITRRIGFNYKMRGRFLTNKVGIDGYTYKHVVDYYLDLLRFLHIKPESKNLDLFVSQEDNKKAADILFRNGIKDTDLLIGIAPGGGTSWGKDAAYKHWPALKFAELADRIAVELKAKVLILGDETEKPISQTILSITKNNPVDLVGKTSLEEFFAIVGKLRILIANDGGPLHIGVAGGIKTVSLFGPVDEFVYGPYPPSKNHIVIKEDLPCRPCYQKFRMPVCNLERKCVSIISVENVFEAVRRLL